MSKYNTISAFPSQVDPPIFFNDLDIENKEVLNTSLEYVGNQDYDGAIEYLIQQVEDATDHHIADLYNMMVDRIKKLQEYLNGLNEGDKIKWYTITNNNVYDDDPDEGSSSTPSTPSSYTLVDTIKPLNNYDLTLTHDLGFPSETQSGSNINSQLRLKMNTRQLTRLRVDDNALFWINNEFVFGDGLDINDPTTQYFRLNTIDLNMFYSGLYNIPFGYCYRLPQKHKDENDVDSWSNYNSDTELCDWILRVISVYQWNSFWNTKESILQEWSSWLSLSKWRDSLGTYKTKRICGIIERHKYSSQNNYYFYFAYLNENDELVIIYQYMFGQYKGYNRIRANLNDHDIHISTNVPIFDCVIYDSSSDAEKRAKQHAISYLKTGEYDEDFIINKHSDFLTKAPDNDYIKRLTSALQFKPYTYYNYYKQSNGFNVIYTDQYNLTTQFNNPSKRWDFQIESRVMFEHKEVTCILNPWVARSAILKSYIDSKTGERVYFQPPSFIKPYEISTTMQNTEDSLSNAYNENALVVGYIDLTNSEPSLQLYKSIKTYSDETGAASYSDPVLITNTYALLIDKNRKAYTTSILNTALTQKCLKLNNIISLSASFPIYYYDGNINVDNVFQDLKNYLFTGGTNYNSSYILNGTEKFYGVNNRSDYLPLQTQAVKLPDNEIKHEFILDNALSSSDYYNKLFSSNQLYKPQYENWVQNYWDVNVAPLISKNKRVAGVIVEGEGFGLMYQDSLSNIPVFQPMIFELDSIEESITIPTGVNFINSINNLPIDLSTLSWTSSSFEEIGIALELHKQNKIYIYDYLKIGDKRTVHLDAMEAVNVEETHVAQDVEIVLSDTDVYNLTDGSRKTIFTWDLVDSLCNGDTVELGRLDTDNTIDSWATCHRRIWCNEEFYNALPSEFKLLIPQVSVPCRESNKSQNIITCDDFCFFRSIQETQGGRGEPWLYEGRKIQYYTATTCRKKGRIYNNVPLWWSRSVSSNQNSVYFYDGENSSSWTPRSSNAISPCGCL